MLELRKRVQSGEGRTNLRIRVKVEHGLASIHARQGDRARYRSGIMLASVKCTISF